MLQGFLVALVATLIYMESRIGGQHMLDRPILIGPIVGLIMGDFTMGLIIGGNLELVWMGLVGIGTSTPPDVVVGSALATALAIKTGASYETTLALAIPIALLAQVGSIGVCILNTTFAHRADKCADKGDWKGVEMSNWMGSALYFSLQIHDDFLRLLNRRRRHHGDRQQHSGRYPVRFGSVRQPASGVRNRDVDSADLRQEVRGVLIPGLRFSRFL